LRRTEANRETVSHGERATAAPSTRRRDCH
jgi:hypothetical protein